jgi:plasmid stabilization system protein ParE
VKLRFTSRAVRDIAEIAKYIRAENPPAAERVRASILRAFQTLASFPEIGRTQSVRTVRKLVTGRQAKWPY